MAQVERRHGKWRVRWYDEAGGRPSKTFDTKADALRWAHRVEHELATGDYIDPSQGRITLAEYADVWLGQQVWRDSTRAQATSNLRHHVLPEYGRRPLATIRPSEVQTWVLRLNLHLAPTTVEVVFGYLRAIMKAAVRDRLIRSSPCDGVRLPRPEPKRIVPLELAEVEAIADGVPPRYRAAILLAAGTGLRQGETFGLTLANTQMLRRRLIIEQQLITPATADDGEVRLGPLKTAASYRTVPLPEVVVNALGEHLARYPVTHPWGLIFTTHNGRPVRRNVSADIFRQGAKAAGLGTDVTFHALRHRYASVLIAGGLSVKAVQGALGHASATETLDTYSHLWPADEDRTRAAIDAAHRRAVGDPGRGVGDPG